MMDYRALAAADAAKYGIDPAIFVRQIDQESGFQPTVVSPAGAIGIAQIVPKYHPEVDPWDPVASLDWAARADAEALTKYGGRWDETLAAYNAGGGAVAQYGGVPPYKETQDYVRSILGDAAVTTQAAPTAPPAPMNDTKAQADQAKVDAQTSTAASIDAQTTSTAASILPAFAFPTLPDPHIPERAAGAVADRVVPLVFLGLFALLVFAVLFLD